MDSVRKKYLIIILSAVLLFANLSFTAQPEEYVIKAVLLEKISSFVEWNGEKIISKNTFTVGIIGSHKFGNVLEETYANRKILGKKLAVKFIEDNFEINNCDVIFIPKLNKDKLNDILEFVKKKPVLTISDTKGYAEKGVHINFYTEENNIRFEINEKSVKESGLKMNHLLLSLAKIVEN
ncbi:MAG: hypothetical protein A2068_06105 [Ignavibacteria bacterium GWB2_35_6b]|nr:MAG: hypothetical protein A2068_06105 [Ignavibacteria bacterium GWB2_35_6b]